MSAKRVVKWTLLLLLLGAGVGGLTLYLLANNVPGDYKPKSVAPELKRATLAKLEDKVLRQFVGPAGEISSQMEGQSIDPAKSFVLDVTQDELSEWVASLPDEALDWLAKDGLKDPAFAIADDRLTFYIYWTKHKKVLGVDILPTVRPDGMLVIELKAVRMGNLAMPQSWIDTEIRGLIQKMQDRLAREEREQQDGFAGVNSKSLRKAASAILNAAAGNPVDPAIRENWGNIRLSRFWLAEGQASAEFVPLVPGEGGLAEKMSHLRADGID